MREEFYDLEINQINKLTNGEYENCSFTNCSFKKDALINSNFSECIFDSCDLSMAEVANISFKEVSFKDCKILGLRFDECNDFLLSFNFENCILSFSSFFKLELRSINFLNCKLLDVDFTKTILTNSVFENCDLNGAIFKDTILDKADFTSSYNFSINPEINSLKKTKFSVLGLPGLLDKYDIVLG